MTSVDDGVAVRSRELWPRMARHWRNLGPPLRPSREDVAYFQSRVLALSREPGRGSDGAVAAMILGVTPEFATHIAWPMGSTVTAVERSQAMIDEVWPGRCAGERVAARAMGADWRDPPLADASVDVVLGDGCFALVPWPEGSAAFRDAIARVLRPGGHLIHRFFVQPDERESAAQVFADLRAGRIGSFHVFKWRLAMAMHAGLATGVRPCDVWAAWDEAEIGAEIGAEELAATTGWPVEVIETIETYRGIDTRYAFPTRAELGAFFGEVFEEVDRFVPEYELGERCITIDYRRR